MPGRNFSQIKSSIFSGTGTVNHSQLVISAGGGDNVAWEMAELSIWNEALSHEELFAVMKYYQDSYRIPTGHSWLGWQAPQPMTEAYISDSESGVPFCAAVDELPCLAPSGRVCTAGEASANDRHLLGVDAQLLLPYQLAYSDASESGCKALVTCSGCGCQGGGDALQYGRLFDGSAESNYANDLECIFNISLQDGAVCGDIVFNFEEFDTEPDFDFVKVVGSSKPVEVLSGEVPSWREFRSTSGYMQIVFITVCRLSFL